MVIEYEVTDYEKNYSVSGKGCFAKCVKENPDYGSGGDGRNCYATCQQEPNGQ